MKPLADRAPADAPPLAVLASGGLDEADPALADIVARARALAVPLLAGRALATGEPVIAHADGTAEILRSMGGAPDLVAAAWLVHAADHLGDPERVIGATFGESLALLTTHARRLVDLQRVTQGASAGEAGAAGHAGQVERVRKMLLAFSRDLRVVLLRLASRLQTLRYHAQAKQPCPRALALEAQRVFAPLAHRLGIAQVKWELEDLAFRFLEPEAYFDIARRLDERRTDREARVARLVVALRDELAQGRLHAEVQGRPKHLWSIWRKMRSKALGFERVLDVIALRVIVDDVPACYAALARVHARWKPIAGEFDDYIARPKPNGYRSLHTVVEDDDGRPVEIQVRTREMHAHAEHGVAAHWVYKEAATGRAAAAAGQAADRIAQARLVVLRQLLAWERDVASDDAGGNGLAPAGRAGAEADAEAGAESAPADDRIYVLTPQAQLVELVAGATPVDFAYAVHTELGHRCRGARVDGAMVPLDTPLANGQTVEIVSAKTGGPSLDWLNTELGYLRSNRSRSKVRAWFNAQQQAETVARGREAVEKLLQREGRTALRLDDLAAQLGFRSAAALFEVVGKDELSLRSVEALLRPPGAGRPQPSDEEKLLRRAPAEAATPRAGVLVVGVESLLTNLARCCRPAPPDAIAGYVTRGRGVAVHRAGCSNLRELAARTPERVIPVAWGAAGTGLYPVDVAVEAADRQGLLRDVSEVFAREKVNVIGVKSQSVRDARGGTAFMTFTVEVADAARLAPTLAQVAQVAGVRSARRR